MLRLQAEEAQRRRLSKFVEGLNGLSVISKKGDLIATDDKDEVHAPYDNCVLIMPALIDVKPGLTAVRLGRVI